MSHPVHALLFVALTLGALATSGVVFAGCSLAAIAVGVPLAAREWRDR